MSFLDEAIYERENSIERQLFGDDDDDANDKENEQDKKEAGVQVEPKTVKRRISKQPRLNPEKLMGPRGIKAIPDEFKDIKLKGKGREADDLDAIMGRLAHWAHRLYPKYNFDDCIQAIETQGKKKVLSSYMRNFRQGLLNDDEIVRNSDDDDEVAAAVPIMPEMEMDDMDRMLSEEISKTTFQFNRTNDDDLGVRALDSTMDSQFSMVAQTSAPPRASSTLTAEQIQKIEENKRQAMERLKKRKAETGVSPKPAILTDEQRHLIEENKRRAMERLKQRQLAMQNVNVEPVVVVESAETINETPLPPVETLDPREDEEMEPLVYDSD